MDAEAHFHARAVSMLNQIQNFENANLKANMKEIAVGSVEKVFAEIETPSKTCLVSLHTPLHCMEG